MMSFTSKNILVVDDEKELCVSIKKLLQKQGAQIVMAHSAAEAVQVLRHTTVDLILCDLILPGMNGIDLLRQVKKSHPEIDFIMLTAHGTIEKAVEAIREKAYDFLTKPFSRVELLQTIQKVFEKQDLEKENRFLKSQLAERQQQRTIIGESPGIRQVLDWIKRVAPLPSTVLITGESGTGKELVARAIHEQSPRAAKRFVAINCGAIPESLIESELFGHLRGSFTGAIIDKIGLFKTATNGTLFLDEIGNIPATLQVKLLRALEEKEIMPVGSTQPFPIDVRIIAASNKNLEVEVENSRFREDLYYRLNVVGIKIPPLRERVEDIPKLAAFFIQKHNLELGKNILKIHPESLAILQQAPWKGNIRELDNVIERAIILCDGMEILPTHLPSELVTQPLNRQRSLQSLKDAVHGFEHGYILNVLKMTKNDKLKTAELLGLSQSSLYRKMAELGLPTNLEYSQD